MHDEDKGGECLIVWRSRKAAGPHVRRADSARDDRNAAAIPEGERGVRYNDLIEEV